MDLGAAWTDNGLAVILPPFPSSFALCPLSTRLNRHFILATYFRRSSLVMFTFTPLSHTTMHKEIQDNDPSNEPSTSALQHKRSRCYAEERWRFARRVWRGDSFFVLLRRSALRLPPPSPLLEPLPHPALQQKPYPPSRLLSAQDLLPDLVCVESAQTDACLTGR